LVVPARLLAAHTTAGLPSDVLLRTDGSGHVRADVARLVAGWPGTQVGDRSMLASEFEAGLDMQAWLNYLIAALAIAYAALATVNSLAVSILDRRREFGLQILTGATRRQVVRMVCAETGVVALLAFGIGTAVAAFTVLPITVASGDLLPSGPVWVYPAIAGALAVVIAPVAVLATRVALRSPPTVAVAGAGG
jgi:putative ABC transport system permease protein